MVLMLINILMNFDFEMEKKVMFVFLVIVWVNKVFLVLGGLISRMFLGMCVFSWL